MYDVVCDICSNVWIVDSSRIVGILYISSSYPANQFKDVVTPAPSLAREASEVPIALPTPQDG